MERSADDKDKPTVEALQAALDETRGQMAMYEAAIVAQELKRQKLENTLIERNVQLFALKTGRSWRLTKPLRQLMELRERGWRQRRDGESPTVARLGIPLASVDWDEVATADPVLRPVRWESPLTVGSERHLTLEHYPPTRIAYRLRLPAGCAFETRVALRPLAWSKPNASVRCSISLLGPDGQTIAGQTLELDPYRNREHRNWVPIALDLGRECEQATLLLESEPIGQEAPICPVVWGDPSIYVPGGKVSSSAPRSADDAAGVNGALGPLVSVLMPVHDPPLAFLRDAIESVLGQTYPRWELCIADDASNDERVRTLLREHAAGDQRIKLVRRDRGGGISAATNAALELAGGEFVAMFDHDDVMHHEALEAAVDHLRAHPGTDLVYTDQDCILPHGVRFSPFLKPDWSPELLRSGMYTGHLGVYRRELVEQVGGFRSEFDGSQDFDLMLRLSERTRRIGHVPRVLYHWRVHAQSTSINPQSKLYAYEAAIRALDDHLERSGVEAKVLRSEYWGHYRTTHRPAPDQRISIVIPYGPGVDANSLRQFLLDVVPAGGHENWELVCGVCDEDADECSAALESANGNVRLARSGSRRERRALLQAGAAQAEGDHLLLLSQPCVRSSDGWLADLLGYSREQEIGVVGAKVLDADGTVWHGGVVIGEGLPLAAYRGEPFDHPGYMGRLAVSGNYSAVDGVVMTPRALFDALGGLGAGDASLSVIDYCLRARERGLRIVFAPGATLHRPREGSVHRQAIPIAELAEFKQRWSQRLPRDPYYHPAFWRTHASFTAQPELPD